MSEINRINLKDRDKLWRDDGIDYDWLIDRLEGENNIVNKRAAYDFVLSSKGELEAYESLNHIRKLLKACDEVNLPEDGVYYQKINEKIMSTIRIEDRKKLRQEKLEAMKKVTTQFMQKNSLMLINIIYLAMRK